MSNRALKLILCVLGCGMVLWIYNSSPNFTATTLKDFYVNNFIKDTGAQNAVTAIYLNYRIFDTLFETLMLLVSVLGVIYLSWRSSHEE